jgi:hypothetical protein
LLVNAFGLKQWHRHAFNVTANDAVRRFDALCVHISAFPRNHHKFPNRREILESTTTAPAHFNPVCRPAATVIRMRRDAEILGPAQG